MAGRIRTMKPEMLEDEIMAGLEDAAWRLFVASWVLADDYGNFRAGTKYLAAQVWQDTSKDAETPLLELAQKGRVYLYEVEGQRYAHIPSWDKHQRIDNAGKRRVPEPPTNIREVSQLLATSAANSNVPITPLREVLTPPKLSPLDHDHDHDLRDPESDSSGDKSPSDPGGSQSPARRVFEAYAAERQRWTTRGPTPVLADKRRKLINARLKEFDEATVTAAAIGIWRSEWHRSQQQTSLDLAMRDAAHVERFAANVPAAAPAPTTHVDEPAQQDLKARQDAESDRLLAAAGNEDDFRW